MLHLLKVLIWPCLRESMKTLTPTNTGLISYNYIVNFE